MGNSNKVEWQPYSEHTEIMCTRDCRIDMINSLYWKWIYEGKSKNYIDTQANLLHNLLNVSYQKIMDNYYMWVRVGYSQMVINEILI